MSKIKDFDTKVLASNTLKTHLNVNTKNMSDLNVAKTHTSITINFIKMFIDQFNDNNTKEEMMEFLEKSQEDLDLIK